ncbi:MULTISPECIES: FAD-dependent oxidoreductase [Rhizobium/Agrobacterium group]|uniref:FAD-dependent oxidoreductase n=1 Tax=Agrobacterium rosae TaxID=1972867 RepID=UPI002033B852|nr:FAD-dependent oxidoreductase [Agrobacterium rosae]MCM2436103.1 FAD-dependent oxidoreductase [Agrobacterium rosae]
MDQRTHDTLENNCYDVVVIGGGVNGTASVRELARAGYKVLLAEAEDFASGASGRSSRMLHCGLRYFETPNPIWDAITQPRRFGRALGMARDAMIARDELASDDAVATRAIELNFPAWREGPFSRWQLDLGLRLLNFLGPGAPPLDRQVRDRVETLKHPIGRHLRSSQSLRGMVSVREYLFALPDRICIDNALDAERHGAKLLLRTRARIASRDNDGLWSVLLETPDGEKDVKTQCVLNMAGTWSDEVGNFGKRLIRGTKGAHIIVRLPEGFAGKGIATLHRGGFPFYGLPLGDDRFYFGPTETLFEGDARRVCVDNEDVDFLLGEANYLLPGLKLQRSDIEQCWAGVRPLTEDPDRPMGARERVVHDLQPQGFTNVMAMTAGPVMSHRSAGRIMLQEVRARIGAPGTIATPTLGSVDQSSGDPEIRAVTHEHATNLYGVFVQRTGAIWNGLISREAVTKTAVKLAPYLGWDSQCIEREITEFISRQEFEFGAGKEN